jgi:hypothetical protein
LRWEDFYGCYSTKYYHHETGGAHGTILRDEKFKKLLFGSSEEKIGG